MPTVHGNLRAVVYRTKLGPSVSPDVLSNSPSGPSWPTEGEPLIVPAQDEHLAIVAGDVQDQDRVLCRVHSECWTGETLGSLKCDCRAQLDAALEAISKAGRGVIVYLRQEGRGIGLGNKIRAYALQNEGKDTVEANQALGFLPDLRSYEIAANILGDLGVRSVALMTNNPDKLAQLEQAGLTVVERVPHWVSVGQHNQDYLAVKRAKLGHHT
jgi:GTP cyclohydrolase II